jgi:hypothetical protein
MTNFAIMGSLKKDSAACSELDLKLCKLLEHRLLLNKPHTYTVYVCIHLKSPYWSS